MASGIRLVLSIPQFPFDPSSGAVRNVITICEQLVVAGFEVHVCGTTAVELSARQLAPEFDACTGVQKRSTGSEYEFSHKGVSYRLLDTGSLDVGDWERPFGRKFEAIFRDELEAFRPEILLTFGGSARDRTRWELARRAGTRVVFSLQNENYLQPSFFNGVDHVLACSDYLAALYSSEIGLRCTALPPPIERDSVVATEHDPLFVTMVNPSPEKGVVFFARLAEEIGTRRPDIPILVFESRGNAGLLVQAGLAGGFDLRRHENILVSAAVRRPSEIYVNAKILVVPSLWREGAGRVVPEALLNGVPPIVSRRGGLPEMCNGGGFIMDIPAGITPLTKTPVEPAAVGAWLDLICRLEDNSEFYAAAHDKALLAGGSFLPDVLRPKYASYFAKIAAA